jgi:hypothetical protein
MSGWMFAGVLGVLVVYSGVVWLVARSIGAGLEDEVREKTGRGPR